MRGSRWHSQTPRLQSDPTETETKGPRSDPFGFDPRCEAGRVSLQGSSADILVGKIQIGAIHNKTCAEKREGRLTAAPTV
jgi:hypothetical protein